LLRGIGKAARISFARLKNTIHFLVVAMSQIYDREVVSRIERLDEKVKVTKAGILTYKSHDYPFFYLNINSNNPDAQNVFISAGMHAGDEPAPVYAALDFAKNHAQKYTNDFNFIIFPCINAAGFDKGTHNNPNGINLNREFQKTWPEKEVKLVKMALAYESKRYCFAVDMHEDDPTGKVEDFPMSENPDGFHLFETSSEEARIGHKIISTLKSKGFPICTQEKVYWDKNDNGLIWEEKVSDKGHEDQLTFFCYLENYSNHNFNPETIAAGPIEPRVQAHKIVLETILDNFRKR